MKRRTFISALPVMLGLCVVVLGSGASCAPSGFADPTQITTVRILASSSDEPYAAPGSDVTLNVLAYDGRTTKPEPMQIYWLPFVCENPPDDAYYNCFEQIEMGGGSDGGAPRGGDAGSGVGSFIGAGGVLNVPTGTSYTFTMPSDAVSSHSSEPGTKYPYGLAVIFNIACAGHLQIVPIDPNNINPQTVPIGCFDSSGNQLGADDWVFGFTRVYAYDESYIQMANNVNPQVSYVDIGGKHLQVTAQADAPQIYTTPACDSPTGCLTMPHCTGDGSTCQVPFGPSVPKSSWNTNPEETDINGNAVHDEIWVDFYATFGNLGDEARLLWDSTTGLVGPTSATDSLFQAPSTPGTGTIWMVVHNDRGGASWVTMPVLVQ
jgi:hypothetical protein